MYTVIALPLVFHFPFSVLIPRDLSYRLKDPLGKIRDGGFPANTIPASL